MEREDAEKKVFFISHSSMDEHLAKAVVDMLTKVIGIKNEVIFYSGNVSNSPSVGSIWFDEMIKSLSETTVLILILTENFFKSNFCIAELSVAIMSDSQQKIFIPFQVAKDISHLGNVLGKYQSCRFDEGDFENNFDKLIVDLKKYLKNLEKVIPRREWRNAIAPTSYATNFIETKSKLQQLIEENENHRETKEKKRKYCKQNTLLCEELQDSLLFTDAAETITLVRSQDNEEENRAQPLSSSKFLVEAGDARRKANCIASRYVLPLTVYNIDFFIRSINDKYKNGSSFEFQVGKFYDETLKKLEVEQYKNEAITEINGVLSTKITVGDVDKKEKITEILIPHLKNKYPHETNKLEVFLKDLQKSGSKLSDNNPLKTYKNQNGAIVNQSDWFKEELDLGHALAKDKHGKPENVRRIIIISGDKVHNQNRDAFVTFFKRYTAHNWRIMFRGELGMPSHFREFCVFNYKARKKPKAKAFFTYLDKEHNNIFTKGAWTQYSTENENYIGNLIDTFETLWRDKNGQTIEEYLSENISKDS